MTTKLTLPATANRLIYAWLSPACLLTLLLPTSASATEHVDQLLDLPLQELLNIEVTSAARREQTLNSVPSAIHVITSEEIQRMGAKSIPEALRMVPGLHVAAIDGNKWVVSSRGFSSRFANKLLVQIDGRSIYSPSYSGVYWDMHDILMSDVERIEVIRGPGATVWGANAVNGVINVITKNTEETQGGLLQTGVGNQLQNVTNLRYGGELNDQTQGRVYLKSRSQDSNSRKDNGGDAHDRWESLSAGFRLDGKLSNNRQWTLQGDVFDSNQEQLISTLWQPAPDFVHNNVEDSYDADGWNLLGRMKHQHDDNSVTTMQLYWDHAERDELYIAQRHDTFDIDLQHELAPIDNHKIILGAGYRHIDSEYRNSYAVYFEPTSEQTELFSAFIQDEITLLPDGLMLTLGTKIEHNDYTGWELQPSAKLLWTPASGHSLWGSIARAVRTPSALEDYGNVVVTTQPSLVVAAGNDALKSENLTAYELGYRYHGSSHFSVDTTVFYNDYSDLTSFMTSPDLQNSLYGDTYGLELSGIWQALPWWQLKLSYSYLQMRISSDTDGDSGNYNRHEGSTPEHMLSLYSAMDLSESVMFDTWVHYLDESSPSLVDEHQDVDEYLAFNARVSWQVEEQLQLSVRVTDLFNDKQQESVGGFFSAATEMERSIYAELQWQF